MKIFLCRLVLWAFVCACPAAFGQGTTPNLAKAVSRPDSWVLQTQGGAQAQLSTDHDALKVTVAAVDGTSWHVQLWQRLPPLEAGKTYAIAFEIRAAGPRSMGLAAAIADGDYHDIGLPREKVQFGATWQWFRRTFVAFNTAPSVNRIPYFIVGDRVGAIWIRHVVIREVPAGAPAAVAPPVGPPVPEAAIPPPLAGSDFAMYLNAIAPGTDGPPAPSLLKPVTDQSAWQLFAQPPAKASVTIVGDALTVTAAQAGTANWHVNTFIPVSGLQEGTRYFLTGQVRADSPAPLTAYLAVKSDTKRNAGLVQTLKPRPEWRSFRVLFVARGTVGQECVLQLMQGLSSGAVAWRGLALRAETPVQAAARENFTDRTGLTGRWPLDQYHTYAGVTSVRRRYLIAPLRFANTRDKFVESKEYFNRLFSSEWPGMGHYWRSVSYGKVRVEGQAVDWIDLPDNWQDYCDTVNGLKVDGVISSGIKQFNFQKLADEVAKRYSMQDFDAIALFPNIRDETSYAGAPSVTMQGKTYPGIFVPDYGIRTQILGHETGHAFGLDHTCGSTPGSGRWDVMGVGGSWSNRHLRFGAIQSDENAYHKIKMGWISDAQIMPVGPGMEKEFHLERIAEPTQDHYLAAVITPAHAGRFFWTLEARMKVGYDMGGIPREGVLCTECEPDRRDTNWPPFMNLTAVSAVVDIGTNPKDEGTAAWDVGKTYVNSQYHFSFSVLSRDATGWIVRVKVDP